MFNLEKGYGAVFGTESQKCKLIYRNNREVEASKRHEELVRVDSKVWVKEHSYPEIPRVLNLGTPRERCEIRVKASEWAFTTTEETTFTLEMKFYEFDLKLVKKFGRKSL